ncbi:MAG: decaprenyl-phosphate phosphoribosyltransferase [Prevotellaceae bacterium]|nr:decaprenyl-phosphate phosphoribosyltransferase [Prevotella sp.]MDD7256841.1 decaprenyl-phosphate phosphoribosyltransferase [Prevotellaceae bacterium]MDY6131584.1 decaprenyl-phosphate phosphoribosyltransferase [Prevotella sp.]
MERNSVEAIIKVIRPKQWIKNVFVLVPLFFGGRMLDGAELLAGIITFFSFSLVASSIYCFNDIIDVEADRCHPVKCRRPIASGKVSLPVAYASMAFSFITGMVLLLLLGQRMWQVGGILLCYYALNIIYCLRLKQYAIVDVCTIAFGFVLRLFAGGFATGIALSQWIVMMTFLITLFLSFAKRRDDVLRMEQTGEAPRKNTIRYNLTFINQAITITASVTLVCYIMYTLSPEVVARTQTHNLYLTTIFVLLGLLRYIQLTVVDKRSGDPTQVMLRDRFTQIIVLLWALTFWVIIYNS